MSNVQGGRVKRQRQTSTTTNNKNILVLLRHRKNPKNITKALEISERGWIVCGEVPSQGT